MVSGDVDRGKDRFGRDQQSLGTSIFPGEDRRRCLPKCSCPVGARGLGRRVHREGHEWHEGGGEASTRRLATEAHRITRKRP